MMEPPSSGSGDTHEPAPRDCELWRIMTNHEGLSRMLTSFLTRPLVQRRLAYRFWIAITPSADIAPCDGVAAVVKAADVVADARLTSIEIEPPISLKSDEGRSIEAKAAIEKEKAGLEKRKTYDLSTVRSYKDWMEDPSIKEAMVGRLFVILGRKNSELEGASRTDEAIMKARGVFQGSNVRTKTGRRATDIYEEVSNAPASLAAARCCIAVAILLRMMVTFRDVEQAYLQAHIDGPDRVPTLVELPRDWWPDSWFYDALRQIPKYVRPLVILCRALYGHPEAGYLWDATFTSILLALGWALVEGWNGVFIHLDGSIIILYVDDVLMAAVVANVAKHWHAMANHVDFKGKEQPILLYLGAQYRLPRSTSCAPRSGGEHARLLRLGSRQVYGRTR